MKKLNKKDLLPIILLCTAAVGITATAIIFKQSPLRVLPLYISLFISLLQSKINRYAPLIGGVNSILYAMTYFHYGLYANAFYALLFSFPLQIITFILWTRRRYGSSTVLKKMSLKQRVFTLVGFLAVWGGVLIVLKLIGSNYAILDTTTSLLGILNTFLTMFAFIEYTVLQLIGGMTSICLYISMIANGTTEQATFLIYSVYSLMCISLAIVRARKLYAEQHKIKKEAD